MTGSLDLPQEIKRVGVSVFLDGQETSPLVQFETPAVNFEVSVSFYTVRSQVNIFGDNCARRPRHLELVITDAERVTFRIRLSENDFSIPDTTKPRRINVGHIKLRSPT